MHHFLEIVVVQWPMRTSKIFQVPLESVTTQVESFAINQSVSNGTINTKGRFSGRFSIPTSTLLKADNIEGLWRNLLVGIAICNPADKRHHGRHGPFHHDVSVRPVDPVPKT